MSGNALLAESLSIRAGNFAAASVTAEGAQSGLAVNVSVRVTLSERNGLSPTGRLDVHLPKFGLGGSVEVMATNSSYIDGRLNVSVHGDTVRIIRAGGGTVLNAGETLEVILTGLLAPFVVGLSEKPWVAIREAEGGLIDETGPLTAVNVLPGLATSPRNFSVSTLFSQKLDFSWEAPADTGGSDSWTYLLELSASASFSPLLRSESLAANTSSVSLLVLGEGLLVHSRILALTSAGRGEAALTEAIVTIPQLHSPTLALSSNVTGESDVTVSVSFRTAATLPSDGRIVLSLPDFWVGNATMAEDVVGVSGGLSLTTSTEGDILLARDGAGAALPPDSFVSFTISGLGNRHTAGAIAETLQQTNQAGDFTDAKSVHFSRATLHPGQLGNVSISLTPAIAGFRTSPHSNNTDPGTLLIEVHAIFIPLHASCEGQFGSHLNRPVP